MVGAGAGLGAVAFRYLIYLFTWLATGHDEFGQQGYVGSAHLPWLGLGFFVLIPVIGGLLYGPLIYRFAPEARGHGVPEVMIAVADNGGRIRPQVALVKALASALCIGTGGSVGREGPIVQIGSALASTLGQRFRVPEKRLRILVACGAGAAIAATFNAPITGVFFGVEIILREFSIDALFTVMLSAMVADAIAIPFLGSQPFLSGFPAGITLPHPADYLLVAVLAVLAALFGLAFKGVLYKTEDLCDRLWGNRPQWARPAVGGVLLGLLLLAIPQMYGVGYPVMFKATGGGYVLWFLILLAVAKIAATSLTMGIGGSGGVFAPSLFIGVTSGMAFGDIAHHLFGAAAGPPALYAVVGMGAVFTSAARAPLTSLASVVEMTGDFTLTLPVMLAVAVASTVSRALSYGTIYTTKLLRRGTDIDRTTPWRALQDLKVADAMQAFQPRVHRRRSQRDARRMAAPAGRPSVPTARAWRLPCPARSPANWTRKPSSPPNHWPRPSASSKSTAVTGSRCCLMMPGRSPAGSPTRPSSGPSPGEIRAAQQDAAQAQEAAEAAAGTAGQAAGPGHTPEATKTFPLLPRPPIRCRATGSSRSPCRTTRPQPGPGSATSPGRPVHAGLAAAQPAPARAGPAPGHAAGDRIALLTAGLPEPWHLPAIDRHGASSRRTTAGR